MRDVLVRCAGRQLMVENQFFIAPCRRFLILLLLPFVTVVSAQEGSVVARRGDLAPVLERDIEAALFARSPAVQKQLLGEASASRQIAEEILLIREWEKIIAKYGSASQEALYIRYQEGVAAVKAGADIAEREARLGTSAATVESRARELWLRDQKSYMRNAAATVTALQIDVGVRGYADSIKRWTEISREVKRKIPFATIAQKWTDDRKTQRKERLVTFRVEASQADGDLYKAVFETLAIGVVSEPIATRFGWLVLQVNEREPPTVTPFEEAKLGIVEKILTGIAAEARAKFIANLKNESPVFYGRLATDLPTSDAAVGPGTVMQKIGEVQASDIADPVKLQNAIRQAHENIRATSLGNDGFIPSVTAPK